MGILELMNPKDALGKDPRNRPSQACRERNTRLGGFTATLKHMYPLFNTRCVKPKGQNTVVTRFSGETDTAERISTSSAGPSGWTYGS